MASVHVYVRVQVRGDESAVGAITDAVDALSCAVLAAGGEWVGGCQIVEDEPASEPEAARVLSDADASADLAGLPRPEPSDATSPVS